MEEYWQVKQRFIELADSNFCTAIAYCLVTGASPKDANKALKRRRNKPVTGLTLNKAIEAAGYTLMEVEVKGFVENLPKKGLDDGTYLAYSSGHVSVIKDGLVLDWTATPESRSKRTRVCFQVVKTGEQL